MSSETTTDTPDFGTRVDTARLPGMARVKDRVKNLFDINCVVALDTLQQLGAVA